MRSGESSVVWYYILSFYNSVQCYITTTIVSFICHRRCICYTFMYSVVIKIRWFQHKSKYIKVKAINFFIQFTSPVITCPKIYPVADTLVTCSTGSRYGSNCDFECSSSATLNGTQSVVCERYNKDSYGYWTWGEQQPFCQGLIIAIFIL
jgi:hypothetical protein